jgi:micrococcal nuclease
MRHRFAAAALLVARVAAAAQAQDAVAADSGPRAPVRSLTPCVIARVVDGDTIRCRDQGLVRLIGIDAPEPSQRPFGAAATAALRALVAVGDTVQLERDVAARDRYRRILAYVWRRGTMLNWILLRQGWAVILTYPPNVQWVDAFTAAQQGARAERRGLWAMEGFNCLPVERRQRVC